MKAPTLLATAALLGCAAFAPLHAQKARSFDHVHFSVPDPEAAQAWYMEHLGGTLGESPDRVVWGGMPFDGTPPLPVQILWLRTPAGTPPAARPPFEGIGISFSDLDRKVAELAAAGVALDRPIEQVPGLGRRAVIRDPWGVRIELLEDAANPGFHHVTLRSSDTAAALAWYEGRFGGERVGLAPGLEALFYDNVYLIITAAEPGEVRAGYGIDHIGWAAHSIDQMAARLRAEGVRFTAEPSQALNRYGHRIAYLEGPDGARVEIVEHIDCAFRDPHVHAPAGR